MRTLVSDSCSDCSNNARGSALLYGLYSRMAVSSNTARLRTWAILSANRKTVWRVIELSILTGTARSLDMHLFESET